MQVNVLHFVTSYTLAFAIELLRLEFGRPRRYVHGRAGHTFLLMLGAVGMAAHTWYLMVRARAADASPLSSPYDWYLLAAWLLAGIYLSQAVVYRKTAIGLFLLPVVLLLIGISQFAQRQPFSLVRASRFWGNVHGTFLLLGTVAVLVGFSAGAMYLMQSHRLKHKRAFTRMPLPSLEWLEGLNRWSLRISVFLVAVGFMAGVVLNRIRADGRSAGLPWNDPVVASSAVMVGWLCLAEGFRMAYRPARQGRKVAYLTVASFVFLVVVLVAMLSGTSSHGP